MSIIPGLQYRNAPAAIDFLCRAFGFERHAVYADNSDPTLVLHAQLVRQGHMIMLGSYRNAPDSSGKTHRLHPDEAGGNTQSCYIMVADVDAHAARAQAEGAHIVAAPQNQEYGGRGYAALDPEGYLWSFGSYDPWAAHAG